MATKILGAAVNADRDTGSFFELAARAANACLHEAGIAVDRVGVLINAGVFRDMNLSEPAVSALIQKRIGMGLEYRPGAVPAFSFDLLNGATGLLHALSAVDCFLLTGEVEYALVVAGDTHPSTNRHVAGFPYTASAGALLLGRSDTVGGFGTLHTCATSGAAEPTAWVSQAEMGIDGRSAMLLRGGAENPIDLAAQVVRACLDEAQLGAADFAEGHAVLLAPTPMLGFRAALADLLGLTPESILAVDSSLDNPYSAAPVHAYLRARDAGVLAAASTVLFLGADDSSAACVAYRQLPRTPVAALRGAGSDRERY